MCGAAYLGTLETAIPFMAARDKLSPQREAEWGGEECWGEGADPDGRWRVLLQSNSQEGKELQRVWDGLVREAAEAAEWMNEPLELLFTGRLENLGGGSVSGETRGEVMEARERLRFRLLTKVLEVHRPKRDRHAWGWRQKDKLSSAWLLALPGGGEGLSNEEFTTTAALNLCLPPPCVTERLGVELKGRPKVVVETHGDNVQATPLPGDHWRSRHDLIKLTLFNLCRWAGLPCEVEVFNLFSRFIPQE